MEIAAFYVGLSFVAAVAIVLIVTSVADILRHDYLDGHHMAHPTRHIGTPNECPVCQEIRRKRT